MSGLFNIALAVFIWVVLFLGSSLNGYYEGSLLCVLFLPIYYFFVFNDAKQRTRKAMVKLDNTLMKDEAIIYKGIDKRPFALFSRRSVFAVTNSRIINLQRGLLGGYEMMDYQWKDLKDVQISENVLPGICGSTLTFSFFKSPWIIVYPDLKTASEIYKVAQLQEQAWEEKRRIRDMEETRAQAGGISIGNTGAPSPTGLSSSNNKSMSTSDIADELIKIKDLLDKGILSDVEFQEMKSKILSRNTQNF
tara:strand:- start:101 stop:847 length:747 start_codon:yes stop_codon:yes gene_type:complete